MRKRLSIRIKRFSRKSLSMLLVVVTIFVGGGLIYLFGPWSKSVEATWFDDNWGYRESVALTSVTTGTNVYVTVTVDTATLITAGKMKSDCSDLRFTRYSGELLPYFINASPGCNNAATTIRVNFNSLSGVNQTIYMYYGNPSATNVISPSGFSSAATATVGSPASEEKATAPVAYWKFDDGTGTTAYDSSGNKYNGTLTNMASPATSASGWATEDNCISGKCVKYDGSDDYTDLGDKAEFTPTNNGFTVSAWVKFTGNYETTVSQARIPIVTKTNITGSGNWEWTLGADNYSGTSNPTFLFATTTSVGGTLSQADSGQSIDTAPAQRWFYVVGTVDSSGAARIYVNGILKNTGSNAAFPSNTSETVKVGVEYGSGNRWDSNIWVDEVKIYQYQKTLAQIQADYNSRSNNEGTGAALGANTKNLGTLNQGLIAYYKLDESSGTPADSSGVGQSTSVSGTSVVAGKFGNGRSTAQSSQEYISISNSTSISLGATTDSYTYSSWIKRNGNPSPNDEYFIVKYSFGANKTPIKMHINTAGKVITHIWDGTNEPGMTSSATVTDNNWHFVLLVRDVAADQLKLYIDGVLDSSTTDTTTGTVANSGTLRLMSDNNFGATDPSTTYSFRGQMDEFRLYNRALSSADITTLYNFAPGPVGYWNFDEGQGSSVNDLSTNANTGTWNGTLGSQWKTGKYGKAGSFNGSDNYISINDSSSLKPNNVSVGAWVRLASTPGTNTIIFDHESASPNFYGYQLWLDTSRKLNLDLYGSSQNTVAGTTALAIGTWYHLMGTYDGSAIRVYVNGVLEGTTALSGNINYTVSVAPTISKRAISSAGYIPGVIDEIKVYDYARTAKQVVEDMNASHPNVGSPVGSPLGYWKFDEGYGNTFNNMGSYGSALNGSNSGATWTNAGKFGKAITTNGSSTNGSVPDVDNVTDFTASQDFSVSFWVKDGGGNANQAAIIEKWAGSGGYAFTFRYSSGGVFFARYDGSNNPSSGTTSAITDSAWHHIVGIKFGSVLSIYKDGILSSTGTDTTTGTTTNSSAVYIGTRGDGTNRWAGSIDEFKIYNYALTADEVKLDMNRGQAQVLGAVSDRSTDQVQAENQNYCIPGETVSCAAPVAEWKFEEGQGSTVNDTSGGGNTGTWQGTLGNQWKSGKFGKTGNFDGSTNNVVVSKQSALDMGSGNFTIEAWVKFTTSLSVTGEVVTNYNGSPYWAMYIAASTNKATFSYRDGSGNSITITGSNALNDGKWHFISGERIASCAYLFVDGIYQTNSNCGGGAIGSISTGCQYARIGAGRSDGSQCSNPASTEAFFPGQIDNIRIFNYARSIPNQVVWDYSRFAPVASWSMDECQGTSINDASGNGYTGTLTIGGTGTYSSVGNCNTSSASSSWYNGRIGKYSSSVGLDGTDDYVTMGDILDPVFTVGAAVFTISAWVKPAAAMTNNCIVCKYGAGEGEFVFRVLTGSKLEFIWFGNLAGTSSSGTLGSTPITDTTAWYHVVATYNGGTVKLYVNGVQEATTIDSANGSPVGIADGPAPLVIGNAVSSGGTNVGVDWNGQIDDTRIFNVVLNATQVKTLYNQGAAVRFGPVTGSP